ncbi:fungal-specific transcription factor domain-domain-containing protein [Clohesyomyces aquaticus]|uniref:Fungal-specific transcription factor domain-domain-containing protein n=1 Tax=Clohesyomyces aquaticus TaxID=1231657 RepID=A0A1Y1ZJ43_9PLEO|nr:fungal-specific transcription factor domain-domain-containing protein [Clohesyomyces aquaticus]
MDLTPNSEPDTEQQTPSSSRWIPRSCLSCNRQKIRCDKLEPCSTCKRVARACVYPPLGPRKRRTKKTIMADMASRISELEKSLAQARNETTLTARPVSPDISQYSSTVASSRAVDTSQEDILVQQSSRCQYVNEVFLSHVIGEGRHIESFDKECHHGPVSSPFNPSGILSCPSMTLSPASFHPPKHVAVKLWQICVDTIDGYAELKVLHVPTDEIKVYSTINDPSLVPPEDLALCFAVYYASAVSLDPLEANEILGHERDTFLFQCKLGLEQALAYGDFLDRPTLTGLQALALYLTALRVQNHSKGVWILNGLAIRIAQSLGLHRDGDRLGLTPFESEIRRRLWWHLLSRDMRAGEDYGLENTNAQVSSKEVKLPSNFEDSDLSPDMQTLPVPRKGFTAMTYSLAKIDLTQAMHKLASISTSASSSSPPSETARKQIIKDLRDRLDQHLSTCNPVVPRQRLVLDCTRFLIRKLDFVTKLQWILMQGPGPRPDFVTEENLVEALEVAAPRLRNETSMLSVISSWARTAYPQYHVTMYMLWHLCVRPEGPNVQRAWEAIEVLFARELFNRSIIGVGSKASILAALKQRAISVREQLMPQSEVSAVPVSSSGPVQPIQDSGSLTTNPNDGFYFDTEGKDWPEWEALINGFQMDSPDVFGL